MNPLLLSFPVLLAGAAATLALRSNRWSGVTSIATQAVASVLVIVGIWPQLNGAPPLTVSWSWPPPIEHVSIHVDGLSAFFLAWSLPMTLLGTIYAVDYLQPFFDKGRRGGVHFALLALVSLSFVIVYSVQNALVFLLGWEVAAVAAWLLVIWDYANQKIRFAGFNYLVSTHVGLFVLVAAFMLMHAHTNSMEFDAFATFLARPSPARSAVFGLLGVSFALKSAFFPFHTWLPRAHSAAPAHVSALMSGVIHKAGLFAFLRFTGFLGQPEEWMGWAVLVFGAASAFFGVMSTTTQRDLKRLLGYSSTENVGIAAMGFGVGYLGLAWHQPALAVAGFAGGLLHVLNHAFFKCLLFYAAGGVYRAAHTVDLERLGGLARRLPRTATLFLLGALASCGLPPLNGFLSELLVYSGLLSGASPRTDQNAVLVGAAACLAFVGAVSAIAMTRAFGLSFLGHAREPQLAVGPEHHRWMQLPMWVLGAGVVVLGLAPAAGLALVVPALRPLGLTPTLSPLAPLDGAVWFSRALFAALALVGAWAWLKGREARRSETWGCGYGAPNPRMQYTGASFSARFAELFVSVLPAVRRERKVEGLLPQHAGQLATHHPDPVEQRMFEVLGQGEGYVAQVTEKIPEQPRFAFAAGLVVLIVLALVLFGDAS